MRRSVPKALAAATAFAMLAAGFAAASTSVNLGDALAPSFGVIDLILSPAQDVAPPEADPAFDGSRFAVGVVRAFANATTVGATDGDAGTDLGGPDRVGVRAGERTYHVNVTVPGRNITTPSGNVSVGTPGVNRTVHTPGLTLHPYTVRTHPVWLNATTPPAGVPGLNVSTPPVAVDTPPVATPPLRVATPEVNRSAQPFAVNYSGADVTLQRLHGTLYLGPLGSQEYELGPYTVGQGNLPPEVPRQVEGEVPPVKVESVEVVDEPAHTLLPAQHHEVLPAQQVLDTDPVPLLAGRTWATVNVPSQQVTTPGAQVPGQQHRVEVPSHHVTTVELEGRSVETPPVTVLDETLTTPPVDQSVQPGLGSLGYFGYGSEDDSSLYPFACTGATGCLHGAGYLKPWVDHGDGALDAAADVVDGDLVVDLDGPIVIPWPGPCDCDPGPSPYLDVGFAPAT